MATVHVSDEIGTDFESRSAFFSSGVMYATLKASGTLPVDRDVLNKCVMYGESRSMQSLSSQVGSGSKSDCLGGGRCVPVS